MFNGFCTNTGPHAHLSQVREFCGSKVSSLGIGTYLGAMDVGTDQKVTAAVVKAVKSGAVVIDTAINYRGQRAERSIGEAIRQIVLSGSARREDLFIATKCGFVPFEGEPTRDVRGLFEEKYVKEGIARKSDLVAGCHCMEPAFIANQIERSRKNLGLETIDLVYLHNPETQLDEIPPRIFYDKLKAAFAELEKLATEGKIRAYGLATWNGLRDERTAQSWIDLEKCVSIAREVGGLKHRFKAVQLPFSLGMPHAGLMNSQQVGGQDFSALEAAKKLGLSTAVSAPLLQSQLCHGLPDFIIDAFPADYSQAHCALAFVASFPNVDVALVGMKEGAHVEHDLSYLTKPRLDSKAVDGVINALVDQRSE